MHFNLLQNTGACLLKQFYHNFEIRDETLLRQLRCYKKGCMKKKAFDVDWLLQVFYKIYFLGFMLNGNFFLEKCVL